MIPGHCFTFQVRGREPSANCSCSSSPPPAPWGLSLVAETRAHNPGTSSPARCPWPGNGVVGTAQHSLPDPQRVPTAHRHFSIGLDQGWKMQLNAMNPPRCRRTTPSLLITQPMAYLLDWIHASLCPFVRNPGQIHSKQLTIWKRCSALCCGDLSHKTCSRSRCAASAMCACDGRAHPSVCAGAICITPGKCHRLHALGQVLLHRLLWFRGELATLPASDLLPTPLRAI